MIDRRQPAEGVNGGRRRRLLLVAGLALIAVGAYVGAAALAGQTGFPLDDSWIHQTYARNLARSGRWEFVPGQVSAGSTAPLWTVLLALGYLVRLPYLLWTLFLGWLSLVWTAWASQQLWQTLWPERGGLWWPALVVLFSWPLIWSAGSGMETLLFTALALHNLAYYMDKQATGEWHSVRLGLLGGLLVLTRLEGSLLVALIGLSAALQRPALRLLASRLAPFAAAFLLPVSGYLALNWFNSGNLLPNTFYAKQAEYARLWQQSFGQRFGQLLFFSLGGPPSGLRGISGAHLVLLPGAIVGGANAITHDWSARRLQQSLPLLWAIGLILLYAWRLPVTYHHGRYLWPALPVWIIYGLFGWQRLTNWVLAHVGRSGPAGRIWRRATALTLVALLTVFFGLGLQTYQTDVAFVNGEMVTVAKWFEEQVEAEALVAAHDIGALGYFAPQPILDLAGLISPQVVPLLDDEDALATFVRRSPADYLVTAPGWRYDRLTRSAAATAVFSTDYSWTRQSGFNNMTVYRLSR